MKAPGEVKSMPISEAFWSFGRTKEITIPSFEVPEVPGLASVLPRDMRNTLRDTMGQDMMELWPKRT